MKKLFLGFILLCLLSGTIVSCDNNKKQNVKVTVSKSSNGWEKLGRLEATSFRNRNVRDYVFLYAKEIGGKVHYGASPNTYDMPIMVKECKWTNCLGNYYITTNDDTYYFDLD